MIKSSSPRGENTSPAEIQNISNHGLWIFVKDKEFFISFAKYPWFKKANIEQICDVKCLHGKHLYWEALDIDVALDALENPEKYPLTYRVDDRE